MPKSSCNSSLSNGIKSYRSVNSFANDQSINTNFFFDFSFDYKQNN